MERIVEALAGELSAATLYRILELRSQVFVVEQSCVYLDPDGRDLEGTTRHLWIVDGVDGDVVACARVLAEEQGCSIGRVVTAIAHRSRGLGAELVQAALVGAPRPVRINAQSHLVDWYARLGFAVDGAEFVEDGIAHTPMAVA